MIKKTPIERSLKYSEKDLKCVKIIMYLCTVEKIVWKRIIP